MTLKNKSESSDGMASAFEDWCRAQQEQGGYEFITPAELAGMFDFTSKYGSGNGYTGTVGTACGMIRRLLREREQLLATLQEHVEDA